MLASLQAMDINAGNDYDDSVDSLTEEEFEALSAGQEGEPQGPQHQQQDS